MCIYNLLYVISKWDCCTSQFDAVCISQKPKKKKASEYFLYWQMSSDLNTIANAFLEYLLLLQVMSIISLTKLIRIILTLIESGNFKALTIKREFFHLFQILFFFFTGHMIILSFTFKKQIYFTCDFMSYNTV